VHDAGRDARSVERGSASRSSSTTTGHLWMLEAAIQEFEKKYQLPGYFRVIDMATAPSASPSATKEMGGEYDTRCHATSRRPR